MKIFEVNMQYFKCIMSVQTQEDLKKRQFNSLTRVYLVTFKRTG